jgi:GT2 family glycosyltransferase
VIIPVSALIATRNRAASLSRTLDSLLAQGVMPAEFIVVDASNDDATKNFLREFGKRTGSSVKVHWFPANASGAAPQRNQGVAHAAEPFIWFFDDDILFEPNCVERLWRAIESDRQLGGVNAMIVNQRYQPPGIVSRMMFTLMNGQAERSFAGKVIGPAINLLPEDRDDLPDVVPVEWLNTTCTMYRRESLPDPAFDSFFTGYSLMEDVTLSQRVAQRGWKLANARTARIFHDSQPGEYKSVVAEQAAMELQNRYHVMTKIVQKNSFADHLRLTVWELFSIASACATQTGRKSFPQLVAGKWRAARRLLVQ